MLNDGGGVRGATLDAVVRPAHCLRLHYQELMDAAWRHDHMRLEQCYSAGDVQALDV